MTNKTLMRLNGLSAALAGFVLRLFLVLKFPVGTSGDAPFYIELASNWLKNGVYGLEVNGHLTPVVTFLFPSYPAFLASIFTFVGHLVARGDVGTGCGGFGNMFRDRADRGPAGAAEFEAARRCRWIVARRPLSIYRELLSSCTQRSFGYVSHRARPAYSARNRPRPTEHLTGLGQGFLETSAKPVVSGGCSLTGIRNAGTSRKLHFCSSQ